MKRKHFALICAILAPLLMGSASGNPMRLFETAWVDRHEPAAEREKRLAMVWSAVRDMPRRERAAVLAVGHGESRWAEYVMRDCVSRPPDASGNCDRGRARGPWQLHASVCPELHTMPRGELSAESIRVGAECARRHWLFALRRCNGRVEQSWAAYGGRRCDSLTASTAFKSRWFKRLGGM